MVAQDILSQTEHAGPLLAVCVGNTRTQFGLFRDGRLVEPRSLPNNAETLTQDLADLRAAGGGPAGGGPGAERGGERAAAVVIASVNPDRSARLAERLPGSLLVGRDIPIHLRHTLEDASTLGQDRALSAIAAYDRAGQACIVIDAGTAITVDFVDGEGVFHGGAIAPGLRMMLAALHTGTAALPELELNPQAAVDPHPFGRTTADAMQKGVIAAARGLAREMSERIASFYDAYPQIVATGGDARLLFEADGVVEHIVPELQLLGVKAAVERALAEPE